MSTYTIYMPHGEYPGQYLPDNQAFTYNPALGDLLATGEFTKATSKSAVYQMDNGVDLLISGSGLQYSKANGILDGGTITYVSLIDDAHGATMQAISGLHWSGSSFYQTAVAGAGWGMASSILSGDDKLVGSKGNDELWGQGGDDTLVGGAGGDNLAGGRGKDSYDGGTSGTDIDQLAFDDAYSDPNGAHGVVVDMAKGTDIDPWGNAETFKNIERIKGTQFADKMLGSAGADEFRPLGGDDQVDGRGGSDTIRYDRDYQRDGNKGVKVDLAAGYGVDGFGDRDTLKNIENVFGSYSNDVLKGDGAANRIVGLFGKDALYGGAGADTFLFGSASESTVKASGQDTIYDFTSNDKIDLSVMDANSQESGDQAFSFIGTAGFDGKAGELRYQKLASDTYIYGDIDGDKKADFAIHLDDAVKMQTGYFAL